MLRDQRRGSPVQLGSRIAVSMFVAMFFLNRNHTPVCHFTNHVLKLNSRVVNTEVVMQARLHITQNPFADGRRNIGDGNMARKRAGL